MVGGVGIFLIIDTVVIVVMVFALYHHVVMIIGTSARVVREWLVF